MRPPPATAVALAVLAVLGVLVPPATSETISGAQTGAAQTEAAQVQGQLETLGLRIRELDGQAAAARLRQETATGRLAQIEQEGQASEQRLQAAQDGLTRVAVQAYLRESGAPLLSLVLQRGLLSRTSTAYVDAVVGRQRRVIGAFHDAQRDRAARRSDLEDTRKAAQDDTEAATRNRAQASAAMVEQRRILDRVKGELADLVAAEAARRAQVAKAAPVALPTGTALTPDAGAGQAAGRQAGQERSNAAPSPPVAARSAPTAPAAAPGPTAGAVPPTTTTTLLPGVTIPPAVAPPPVTADPSQFVTFRVFTTQYQPLTPNSVEVAVPDKCAKWAALGQAVNLKRYGCAPGYAIGLDYRVLVTRDSGQRAEIPVKDVGPWNIDDNYWDPAAAGSPRARRNFTDLPQGKPASQAGFYDKFNTVADCQSLDGTASGHPGPADQFGRCVLNPAGIDLSPAAAAALGIGALKNEWVTVSFLWERK